MRLRLFLRICFLLTLQPENELLKREASFSSFRNINLLVCTWNVDAAKPESLASYGSGDAKLNEHNLNFLENCLRSVDAPDVLVFGFQEVIDLEDKKLTASKPIIPSIPLPVSLTLYKKLYSWAVKKPKGRRTGCYLKRCPDHIGYGTIGWCWRYAWLCRRIVLIL